MASKRTAPITFAVPGIEQRGGEAPGAGPGPAGLAGRGRVKRSVRVAPRARDGEGEVRVEAVPGEDVVVLHVAGGPALVLHPETARDLLQAQQGAAPVAARGAGGGAGGDDAVRVGAQLRWPEASGGGGGGASRGRGADVLLSALEVVTDLVTDPAADFVAAQVVQRVDAQVEPGVYRLDPEALGRLAGSGARLARVPASDGPVLVLVHGTFVETSSTFGKLWTRHPALVQRLFDHYARRVYALDHPTLRASPIANARALAEALPADARVHLLTHSRGGLVAEALARVCANPDLGPADLALFEGAAYRAHREDLQALAAVAKRRRLRVERVVRVGCPARGTLLASKRLDAYLSVLKWALELAGVPVAPAVVDFLGEVARRRADPELIPGLAAMIPDSPVVQWLHAVEAPIPGDLRVVAGDLEGDSLTSWLKALVADGFFWTDNDLVVQTRSMYGGAPRADGATFLLDRGGRVSHFDYFANERTAEAVVRALTDDAPQGFRAIGPLSWAGESSTGVRAPRKEPAGAGSPAARPALFLLPGLLGSNLQADGRRLWLGWRFADAPERLAYAAGRADGVAPDGPLGGVYDGLAAYLAEGHEVIPFAFDWRRPLEDEARRLAAAVDAALAAREKSGQPVRILAHSAGGLLARALQLEAPETWNRMMARPGARLLMLGTPNAGCWAPMQVLSGDDTLGDTLGASGAPFRGRRVRELLAGFPGFLQLQAGLLDGELRLDREETWRRLAEQDLSRVRELLRWHADPLQQDAFRWGVPRQDVLDAAAALRERLDAQAAHALARFGEQLALVVGKADATPDGFDARAGGLVYLEAADGDGRVTLASARLAGVRTWRVERDHGGLPAERGAFEAYRELLERGDTVRLQRVPEGAPPRAAAAVGPGRRPARLRSEGRPPSSAADVLSTPAREPPPASGAPLRITVENANLKFVREPLLVGHYRALRLTGTEHVLDELVDGAMKAALEVGDYPDRVGTHAVFANATAPGDDPTRLPCPQAVVVVGLGDEGALGIPALVETVRLGAIAWSRRVAERGDGREAPIALAATLLGSGGRGVSANQAALAVAQAVEEANARLAAARLPQVRTLKLVEKYLDRASDAWRALRTQAKAAPWRYEVTDHVVAGPGGVERPPGPSYRGAEYDYLSAELQADGTLAYVIDSRRARHEVRAHSTQTKLVQELQRTATHGHAQARGVGRTLFDLLFPPEIEPFLLGTAELQLNLEPNAAAFAWELLDTESGGRDDRKPWAIRTRLLRKLRTPCFREAVVDASLDARALVIGEPKADAARYPRLPAARAEAHAVAARLSAELGAERVKALVAPEETPDAGPDACTVVNALLERPWRIIHISGHGREPTADAPGGVVLSNDTILGRNEIRSMRVVPELVFVNCCHLGAMGDARAAPALEQPRFAANLADALIREGVKCVVAAGWAVADEAARTFATTFYDALLARRQRFVDAVAEARERAFECGGNTWAAYQCYGDPDWTFVREGGDAQRPLAAAPRRRGEQEEVASSRELELILEALATDAGEGEGDADGKRERLGEQLRDLEARHGGAWGARGSVAEAFGAAFSAVGDPGRAVEWYRRALAANDGSASLAAVQQLGNVLVREGARRLEEALGSGDGAAAPPAGGRRPEARAAAARGGARGANGKANGATPDGANGAGASRRAAAEGRAELEEGIALLERAVALNPSIERESLCGSAYKRRAMVARAAGEARAEAEALRRMREHYERAEQLARDANDPQLFYPALHRVVAQLADPGANGHRRLGEAEFAALREVLLARTRDAPDFWSVAGLPDLALYEALARGTLAEALPAIERQYEDLHRRVAAPWRWRSVLDTARFVLSNRSRAERSAARPLLERLEAFARGA